MPLIERKLDILIPTCNRSGYVTDLIDTIEKSTTSQDKTLFGYIVSDNGSDAKCQTSLSNELSRYAHRVTLILNRANIGLEKNAILTLRNSRAEYVMWMGDDDLPPNGYVSFILKYISNSKNFAMVINGVKPVFSHNQYKHQLRLMRTFNNHPVQTITLLSDKKKIIQNCLRAHQLSCLVHKRKGVLDLYEATPTAHGLYLFISFLFISIQNASTLYILKGEVIVSKNNYKYWDYGNNHLIADAFIAFNTNKNFAKSSGYLIGKISFEFLTKSLGIKKAIKVFIFLILSSEITIKNKVGALMSLIIMLALKLRRVLNKLMPKGNYD